MSKQTDMPENSEPTESDLQATEYEGFIDAIEDGRVYGWALDPADPDKVLEIDIFHGDAHVRRLQANRYREDLTRYADGSGKHAFVLNLPKALWSVDPGTVYACFAGTNVPLMRGPRCSELKVPPAHQDPDVETDEGVGSKNREQGDLSPRGPLSDEDIKALIGRIEGAERGTLALLRILQFKEKTVGEQSGPTAELRTEIEKLRKATEQDDVARLRQDETLKRLNQDIRRIEAKFDVPQYQKGEFWGFIISIIAILISSYSIFWNVI